MTRCSRIVEKETAADAVDPALLTDASELALAEAIATLAPRIAAESDPEVALREAAALAPGLSRSGSTLMVAMFQGLRRDTAARFVFLMSLPAVFAVAVKETYELSKVGLAGAPVTLMAVGLIVSAIVGYVTVKYFLRYLAGHSLAGFAYYRFALAAVTFGWLLMRQG